MRAMLPIDTDAIAAFVEQVAGRPTPPRNPDFGAGRRGNSTTPSGVNAGREMYDSRRGGKPTTTS